MLVWFAIWLPLNSTDTPSAAAAPVAPAPPAEVVAGPAATRLATSPQLLGPNCSRTTGMMAERVMNNGEAWSTESGLLVTANDLDSQVAAPYILSNDASVHLVATELVERLTDAGQAGAVFSFSGRMIDVDGVRYVVLTSYRVVRR